MNERMPAHRAADGGRCPADWRPGATPLITQFSRSRSSSRGALVLLVVQLIAHADLPHRQLRAAHLDGRGEDLRVVGLARARGEARRAASSPSSAALPRMWTIAGRPRASPAVVPP